MNNLVQKRDLVVTRVFNARIERVWKAWSESEEVMKWWGPAGFTAPVAKMNFREGGTSLVCMRAPVEFGGQDFYNTWTYTKIVPVHEIQFILHFTDQDGNQIDPTTMGLPSDIPQGVRHLITFKDLGSSKTEMSVTEFGYTSDETLENSKIGLEQCLDKMDASFSI